MFEKSKSTTGVFNCISYCLRFQRCFCQSKVHVLHFQQGDRTLLRFWYGPVLLQVTLQLRFSQLLPSREEVLQGR